MSDEAQPLANALSLSIVIPTRNRHEPVVGVVEKLLSDDGFLEIVVVDDGSTDATFEMLRVIADQDARLRVVKGRGKGASEARALGASEAHGDIVLFLDDDVLPGPGLARMHLGHHSAEHQVVVGYMPTSTPDQPGRHSFATLLYADEYEKRCEKYDQDPSRILRNLWMGNVSMPKETFLEVTEQWPEPLPRTRHEDQHIGLRLASVGIAARFDRQLRATHQHHRTLQQFRRECRLYGAGRASLERRHGDMVDHIGVAQFREGLNRPLAALVAASTNKTVAAAATSTLATITWALGTVRLFDAQMAAGRLLRRVELQQGYLASDDAPRRTPTS